jgi:prepilin-type N-terminal cleavage/methylation domain-containing protein
MTRRAHAGFTLIEMLIVLSIIALLMGISIGALRRSVPARSLARDEVLDALRQARLFALQENAPALVRLEMDDELATVTAVGKKTVGGWHLEGDDLDGFPHEAHAAGVVPEENGVIGRAVRLSATEPAWVDCGLSPSFDSPFGFAFELFVKVDAARNTRLLSKGKAVELRCESDGTLTLQVRMRGTTPEGEREGPRDVFATATSPHGALVVGRFVKVSGGFDGASVRLAVDDVVVDEQPQVKTLPFAFDKESPLLVGSYDAPAGFAVDEVKWAVYTGETQILRDMTLPEARALVRFGPDGSLDPQFHQGPAEIDLISPPLEPDQPGDKTVIRVGVLGDLH